jgi:hypothetical protein
MKVHRVTQSRRKSIGSKGSNLVVTTSSALTKHMGRVRVSPTDKAAYELSEIGYGLASTKNLTKKDLEKKYAGLNLVR